MKFGTPRKIESVYTASISFSVPCGTTTNPLRCSAWRSPESSPSPSITQSALAMSPNRNGSGADGAAGFTVTGRCSQNALNSTRARPPAFTLVEPESKRGNNALTSTQRRVTVSCAHRTCGHRRQLPGS